MKDVLDSAYCNGYEAGMSLPNPSILDSTPDDEWEAYVMRERPHPPALYETLSGRIGVGVTQVEIRQVLRWWGKGYREGVLGNLLDRAVRYAP